MSGWSDTDIANMRVALEEARLAGVDSEVPVGAVLVLHDKVIARSGNRTVADHDPSAHAEVVVLRNGGKQIGNHRLNDATLYVTLEPCTMCVGAIVQARVRRVVFGAYDRRAGALGSALDLTDEKALNHNFEISGGVMADECSALLTEFFEARRS